MNLVVGRGVPAQLVSELAQLSPVVNTEKLQIRHTGEIFEMLQRQRLAEAGVVCPSGINPTCGGQSRGPGLGTPRPRGPPAAAVRLLFGLDYIDLVDDHA